MYSAMSNDAVGMTLLKKITKIIKRTLASVPSTQYPAMMVPFLLSVHQFSNSSRDSPLCIIPGLAITTDGPMSSKWSILCQYKTLKVCFYMVQYPIRWTAQSALHFTSRQTCSFRHQLGFSGRHSSHAEITREDYLLTFPQTVYSQVLIYTAE